MNLLSRVGCNSLALLFGVAIIAQTAAQPAQATIAASQFTIAGISIGSDKPAVIAAFGKPVRSERYYSDYLDAQVEELDYGGLIVRLGTGKVIGINCKSPRWATSDGLRVGESVQRATTIYGQGRPFSSESGPELRYVVGLPRTDCELVLHVRSGKVVEIELWLDLS
jgi:hypothetical protein